MRMKFRNLETGKIENDIYEASAEFCSTQDNCRKCPLEQHKKGCDIWCDAHPYEAARLMGYEVVEETREPQLNAGEKEANMDKPLKDWTLGELKDYCHRAPHDCIGCKVKGDRNNCPFDGEPAKWILDEKPRFTQQDVEDAKYIKRILKADLVSRNQYGNGLVAKMDNGSVSVVVNSEMFPSIIPGQSYTLDEIIGGAE